MSLKKAELSINDFLVSTLPNEAKEAFIALLELNIRGRKDICVFAEEILGMPLNDFQRKFLTRTTTPRAEWSQIFGDENIEEIGGMLFGKNIAFPSNQVGKTVMIAIKHIWMNYYKIGLDLDDTLIDKTYYATLNLSPHSRQVKQCFAYVKEILEERFVIDEEGKKRLNKLSPLSKDFMVGDNVNLGEIRFANKSIFYSVPTGQDQASSLAGGQFGYISYDECSQSLHLQNELGAKVLSRLIKYGVGLDLISTPEVDCASHQFYFHICKLGLAGKEGWWALNATLDDNKFIPSGQRTKIKNELFATDKQKYRQVVFGEFISGGKRFFESAEVDNLWRLSSKIACRNGRQYLLVSDWGMADTGDPSVFMILDYTEYAEFGKIYLVNHERVKGGSPFQQFALLRTLYDAYTWYEDDGITAHKPKFLMDAGALGGVVIKKMLIQLSPKGFDTEKDEALFILRREMSAGRSSHESEVDGAIIEENLDYGNIRSYYIDELNTQLGNYHLEDKKLEQDFVMCLMMGVSFIIKKTPKGNKVMELNPLSSYNNSVGRKTHSRGGNQLQRHAF